MPYLYSHPLTATALITVIAYGIAGLVIWTAPLRGAPDGDTKRRLT